MCHFRALKAGHEHSMSRVCNQRSPWELFWEENELTICHPGSIQHGQCTPQWETRQQRVAPAPCPEHTQSAAKPRPNINPEQQSSSPAPREAQGDGTTRKFSYCHQQGSGQEKQGLLQRAGREGKNRLQSKMILASSHRKGHRQGLKPWIKPGSSSPVSAMVYQASLTFPFPPHFPSMILKSF